MLYSLDPPPRFHSRSRSPPTRACQPTDGRNDAATASLLAPSVVSSSFLDVLHSLDPPPLPFPLSLTPTRTCLLTDSRNDVTPASFLAPSVVSPSFLDVLHSLEPPPLSFPLSLAPTQASPLSDRLHSLFSCFISLVQFCFSSSLLVSSPPLRSGVLHLFVKSQPQAPSPFHTAACGSTATHTSSSLTDHPSSAFRPYLLSGFERVFASGFQPSRVTGLQATSSPPD